MLIIIVGVFYCEDVSFFLHLIAANLYFYPPSQKTLGAGLRMNAKKFLLRRDSAPDLPALLAQAWRAGEVEGRRYSDRQIG